MLDADQIRLVREEVKRQLQIILSGQASANDKVETETIDNMYPGMPSIENRPVMHPYGFASRAPAGTISVVGKQGNDPTNRLVLGHRDSLRASLPVTLGEGDAVIYASDGKTVLSWVALAGKVPTLANSKGSVSIDENGVITAKNDQATITVDGSGNISGKGAGGSGFKVGAGKAAFGGTAGGEVVAAFAQALNLLATDATPGFGGPLVNAAQYQLLYQKINPTVGSLP